MARNFIQGNSEDIRFGSSVSTILNAAPDNHTFLAKMRCPSQTGTDRTVIGVGSTTNGSSFHSLLKVMSDGFMRIFVQSEDTTNIVNFSAAKITANVWHTVGQIKTGDDCSVVLDTAIATPTNAAFGTWSDNDTFDIGALASGSSTRVGHLTGDVAEVAVWSVSLTQEELDAYHAGMSPLRIRPTALIFYAPLYGTVNEVDLSGNGNGVGTLTNTPAVASHPFVSPYISRKTFAPFLGQTTPYTPPLPCDVDFNLQPAVPPTGVLKTGELGDLYTVNKSTLSETDLHNQYSIFHEILREGELLNKYVVTKATLSEGELHNQYAVNAFRLAQGELDQKYSVAGAFLRLGELLNKYGVAGAKVIQGELGNRYSVDAFRLKTGELSPKYKVNPVILTLGELQEKYRVEVLKLTEGELQQEYEVQDQKLEAQLLALYSIRFAKQFESIYGAKVSRQLLAKAFYSLQKQFDAIYQIRTTVAQQLDSLFEITNTSFVKAQVDGQYSMARIQQQLDGNYSIGPVVQAQLEAPYILATVPVEKQLDSIYDIKITNTVEKQVKGIYSILTTQIINITGQPTVTLNGDVLDIESADISIDEGSFIWRANIGILDIEDYVKFNINDDIILDLYGETFNLVIESKNLTRGGPADIDMGLVAVSPAIKHDFPRAAALDLSFTSPILAEAAAEQALGGEDIDWQISDWLIPANRLAIKDGSPIQLVKNIVEAAGGILESKPDGQLVARPLFPVSLPDFDTAALDQTYSDSSDNLSVSESFSPTRRLNLFRILDITASKRDSIEFDLDEGSVTEGDLKLFPSPFETNRIVRSSRGSEIGFQLLGVATEEREQQLEFKEGFATLSRPIDSFTSIVWEATDLGGITFTQGDNKVFSASVVNLYSLATIKYQTRFIKYRVTGIPDIDVQFRVEVT